MKTISNYKKSWGEHKGIVVDSINKYDVLECELCGFKHIVPIPTQDELKEIYTRDYYSKTKPEFLGKAKEDIDWWNSVYQERYAVFEKLLPNHRRKLLDIGSGPGFFLLHGKERGWNVTGIEPSSQAFEHSRQLDLNVHHDFFNKKSADSLETYDVVHLSEVLEHVADPIEILNLIWTRLNKNGIICIVAPNDYSPFQETLKTQCGFKPWWVCPPHHINYFNFVSIQNILRKGKFELVSKTATFPIDIFLLMGENYVENDALGSECHSKIKNFEKNISSGNPQLKKAMYDSFAELGIGREFVVVARKIS